MSINLDSEENPTMEKLIKDLNALSFDIHREVAAAEQSKRDIERGLRNAHVADEEGVSIRDQNDMLFRDLSDAMYDFDRMKERLQEIENMLDDLVESVEFETVSNKIWS